ncbi:cell division protein FtsW (lipid II flippase) [Salirhabdus euzebyi]|uniref:Cell division protein FtsW (Lipid II flippase) n=1 Tax=Salirhabdus euzebyi TaxID=394506 RepID=A0A841Q3W7_9BACI|nr:FtsW/RodA/SpoVE family cell cycle protein [Salirhabdus euzebyi]MBB6453063.1 cell division protein FtsW (lipid II flippase) [Salirhabdus euzebyi]
MSRDNTRYNIDYFLLFIVLLLGVVSCLSLYTLQDFLPAKLMETKFYLRQIVWYILGAFTIVVMMILDYDRLRKVAWFLYGVGVLSLAGLYVLPETIALELNGARGWYQTPFGTIQPAEFMKVFLIIILAHVITSHNEKRKEPRFLDDIWLLLKITLISIPPIGLVAMQPDLGSAVVFASIVGFLVLVSGIRWRILLLIGALVAALLGMIAGLYLLFPELVNTVLKDTIFAHVFERFEAFFDPNQNADQSGYQINKALLAIGSGQLLGKGLMNIEVYNIPERHSDMIFTVIAEQAGFLGASFVVTLFFLLIYRIIHTALACKDPFGSYLCTGVVGMITYQVIQNIGMSIKLLPITGLPLPFISSGGSSLIAYMMMIGLVLNVKSRTRTYMFDD